MRLLARAKSTLSAALLLVAAVAYAQVSESATSDAALARRLAHALDSLSAAGAFSGTVLLAHHDLPIFEHAYGIADRAHGTPNTVETAYNLASVRKLFTATAIEQLAHAGRLDTSATIDRCWPEYPNRELARKATVAQLLAMSSGIGGDIFGTPATGHALRTIPEYLRQFVNEPLDFEPGTKPAYSNAGYVVLGALVERVSGEEYQRYQHGSAGRRTGPVDGEGVADGETRAGARCTAWRPHLIFTKASVCECRSRRARSAPCPESTQPRNGVEMERTGKGCVSTRPTMRSAQVCGVL